MARLSFFLAFFLFSFLSSPARSEEISGPEITINANSDIFVTFSLKVDPQQIKEIREGMDKELKLYVDLFKIWKVWPDEFVSGRIIKRTLKSDPIKQEYVATSLNGNVLIEKRFRSSDSMIDWVRSVKDLKLANSRELEPGQYFVRVTAESKIRKLPPVIGYFFIFLSENEFKIHKDSAAFTIEGRR